MIAREDLPPIKEISIWDTTIQLNAAAGYKDNVLLSPGETEQSTFLKAGAEILLWRLPTDGIQFSLFALASDTRFLDSVSTHQEQLGMISAKLERTFNDRLLSGVAVQYVYQDQVFDVSATEPFLRTVRLNGHGLSPRIFVRYALTSRTALEADYSLTRQYLRSPLDDYWEHGPQLSWVFKPNQTTEFTLRSSLSQRSYDHRSTLSGAATSFTSDSLVFLKPGIDFAWTQILDKAGRWRLRNVIGAQRNLDNGNGFFNYNRYSVQKRLLFQKAPWECSFEGSLYYYDFENQPLSGRTSIYRHSANLAWGLSVYRRISRHLKAGLEGEQETFFSNEAKSDYLAHTVSINLAWEF